MFKKPKTYEDYRREKDSPFLNIWVNPDYILHGNLVASDIHIEPSFGDNNARLYVGDDGVRYRNNETEVNIIRKLEEVEAKLGELERRIQEAERINQELRERYNNTNEEII